MRSIAVASLLLAAACSPLWAQSVALVGVSGSKALLVIDGAAPKFVGPGQTQAGVKLVDLQGESATLEVGGKRHTMRVGDAPVSVGGGGPANSGGRRVVLTADGQGHFLPQGQINGKSVQFMVDTGATVIALGESEAKRINLAYEQGQKVMLSTANGAVIGYQMQLATVRIGEVTAYDVTAVVMPQPMPYVLLGNSFLKRFQMQRTNDQMTLEKR